MPAARPSARARRFHDHTHLLDLLEARVMLDATVVTIKASDAKAAESSGKTNPGVVVFTRAGGIVTEALEVAFTLGGTAEANDYAPLLNGLITIPAGKRSIALSLTPTNDGVAEDAESLVVTLQAGAGYALGAPGAQAATITITDGSPIISLTRKKDGAEGKNRPVAGTFTLARTGGTPGAVLVHLVQEGDSTATPGDDFTGLDDTVEIPAGRKSVVITINPVQDTDPENTESVHLSLVNQSTYHLDALPAHLTATVVITDNPRIDFLSITGFDTTHKWSLDASGTSQVAGNSPVSFTGDSSLSIAANGDFFTLTNSLFNVTPSNGTVMSPTLLFVRGTDGVFIDSITNGGTGLGASGWDFESLQITPEFLGTRFANSSPARFNLPPSFEGFATGRGKAVATFDGVQQVTVPAGDFDAAVITVTLTLSGSGRLSIPSQGIPPTRFSFAETLTLRFYVVDGVGPVQFDQHVTLTVSAQGDSESLTADTSLKLNA